jgi:lipopolysaccharide biosynthesis glycosyltransferase
MKEAKRINDEMTVLLMQLVAQYQIKMAGIVLKSYFVRCWKITEDVAAAYVRLYFKKYFPKELDRYMKHLKRAS